MFVIKLITNKYKIMQSSKYIISILVFVNMLFSSCAKLPIESVTLSQYIIDEGERMHKINLQLINSMFKEKRDKIDEFIKNDYTPSMLNNMMKSIETTDKPSEVIPAIVSAATPKIVEYRNQLQSSLETTRIKILSKLDDEYNNFKEASKSLKDLLNSAVKVDSERKKIMEDLKKYSGGKVDINSIESALDNYTNKGGEIGAKITELNSTIDGLLNK
jgi:hypothetical protein